MWGLAGSWQRVAFYRLDETRCVDPIASAFLMSANGLSDRYWGVYDFRPLGQSSVKIFPQDYLYYWSHRSTGNEDVLAPCDQDRNRCSREGCEGNGNHSRFCTVPMGRTDMLASWRHRSFSSHRAFCIRGHSGECGHSCRPLLHGVKGEGSDASTHR